MRLDSCLVGVTLLALAFSAGAAGARTPSTAAAEPGAHAEPKVQQMHASRGLAKAGKLLELPAPEFTLDPPAAGSLDALGVRSKNAPMQVGITRDVPQLGQEASTRHALQWTALSDGTHVAAITVGSPSASSVRAALRIDNLPAGAVLRFAAPGSADHFEFTADEVNATIARNIEAGDATPQARLFWSPLVEGDSVRIELRLARGADPRDVRISVPHVAHLVTSAAKDFFIAAKSASCEIDAMCSSTPTAEMNSVARMLFSTANGTFLCTGTLLADQDPASTVPYFLTANHCISTQAAASSLETWWFYRSTSCNSGATAPSAQHLAGGATLLYASAATDTSFMRLNTLPPAGATYAGWFAGGAASLGTAVSGLHHPGGDLLKDSEGSITGHLTCTPPSSSGFTCSFATAATGTFYSVGWTSGLTEPGSSGSGLFRRDGLLVGQLYGGPATACPPAGDDVYGRFDVAYNNALKTWLSTASVALTVSRNGSGIGTVTSSPSGIDCGSTCSASFPSGTVVVLTPSAAAGSVFTGWSGACTGTGACQVTMNAASGVTATFTASTSTMTVTAVGSGTVVSSPAGINCSGTCSASFPAGTAVSLVATPASGTAFQGWGGACSGNGGCTVTMNGTTSVSASFGTKAAATVGLLSSANPAYPGQPLVLAAGVTGISGAGTGTVSFTADGAPIAGCAGMALVGGVASCAESALAAGSHVIGATYSGDTAYVAGTAAPLSLSVQSAPAAGSPAASRLFNISTRGKVLTGNDVMIGGFIIGGSTSKTVVVRARGPSLIAAGIPNALANPTLQLVRSSDGATLAANDDWQSATNAAQVSASGFAPSNPLEAAVMVTLAPGAYTAIVAGAGGGTGVGIVEVFEVDHPEVPLANISTRGEVLTGGDVMIGGFIIQGTGPQTVVVRARGPSLVPQGVSNPLWNPVLQLVRSSDGATLAINDDWASAPNAAALAASGFAPPQSLEAAVLVTLDPGAYTVIVSGVAGSTGVGLIEVFTQ